MSDDVNVGQDAAPAPSTDPEVPQPTTDTTETQEQQQEQQQEQEVEENIAGFTSDEIRQLLAKAAQYDQLAQRVDGHIRKMDSQYGELKSRLTQKGEPRKLAKSELKRISELWGDDGAEAIAEDLSRVLTAPTFNKDELFGEFDSRYEQRLAELDKAREKYWDSVGDRIRRELQEEILDSDESMAGWREKAAGLDLATWESLQSPDKLKQIDEDFKTKPFSKVMKGVIQEFDKWDAARKRRAGSKQNLEHAVNPSGSPAPNTPSTKSAAEIAEQQFKESLGTQLY